MTKVKEKVIEDYLIEELKKIGVETRKVKFLGVNGAPDRLILTHGGIYVECKRPGETLRKKQVEIHKELHAASIPVMTIDTKEQVDALVGNLGKCTQLNKS